MHIQFSKNNWTLEDVTYAYSLRFPETPVFTQEADYICNKEWVNSAGNYENIPLITKKTYHTGTKITTRCAFDHYGAPLILLVNELETDSYGVQRFGNYYEVVLYEGGINVWHMWKEGEAITWKWLLEEQFPVSAGDIHTLSVSVGNGALQIQADNRTMAVPIPELTSFHAGITACEGCNRFYELWIEQIS